MPKVSQQHCSRGRSPRRHENGGCNSQDLSGSIPRHPGTNPEVPWTSLRSDAAPSGQLTARTPKSFKMQTRKSVQDVSYIKFDPRKRSKSVNCGPPRAPRGSVRFSCVSTGFLQFEPQSQISGSAAASFASSRGLKRCVGHVTEPVPMRGTPPALQRSRVCLNPSSLV